MKLFRNHNFTTELSAGWIVNFIRLYRWQPSTFHIPRDLWQFLTILLSEKFHFSKLPFRTFEYLNDFFNCLVCLTYSSYNIISVEKNYWATTQTSITQELWSYTNFEIFFFLLNVHEEHLKFKGEEENVIVNSLATV